MGMRYNRFAFPFGIAMMGISCWSAGSAEAGRTGGTALNELTTEETRAGWILLFDGKTTDGWRKDTVGDVPSEWTADQGALTRPGSSSDRYILTRTEYENFELTLDWSIQEYGDGGIFIRAWNDTAGLWNRAPEFQIVDQWRRLDALRPAANTGACAWIYPPLKDVSRPIGEYNQVRLVVHGHHVEHWLNGEKIVVYEVGSKDWVARLKQSKFSNHDRMGVGPKGFIGMQAFTPGVRYRNIKLLPLPPGEPSVIRPLAHGRVRAVGNAWTLILPGEAGPQGAVFLDLRGRMLGRPYRMLPAAPTLMRR
jgi:hypothetical protein